MPFGLWLIGIEVRPDRGNAVRVSASQAELEATANIVLRPSRRMIRRRRGKGAHERSIAVGSPWPGVADIEMTMGVDERRPDEPMTQVMSFVGGECSGGRYRRNE